MSRQQQTKQKKFYKVAGRGLIKGRDLDEKFKMMTLGTGAPARKKVMEEVMVDGGSVRHHNRPYQLKDMEQPKKSASSFKPIEFKL